jgi:hypothetical protein
MKHESVLFVYIVYERGIVTGKQLLREGDYLTARDDFLKLRNYERGKSIFRGK